MSLLGTLGTFGEQLNLQIRQGATFGRHTATMKNPDGTPVNLTGSVIRGSICKPDGSYVCAIEVEITNAAAGTYQFWLTAATTARLTCGALTTDPASRYVWDLEMQDAALREIPLYHGDVRVMRGLTR